jgi:hypothetical protein
LRSLDTLEEKVDRFLSPEESLLLLDSNDSRLRRSSSSKDKDKSNPALLSAPDSASDEFETRSSSQGLPTLLGSPQVPAPPSTEMQNILAWPAVQALLEYNNPNLSYWDGQHQLAEAS